jgi:hypothetical protein
MVGLISYGEWSVDLLQRGWVACCSLQSCSMPCSLTFSKPGSWFMGLSIVIWYNLFLLVVLPSWWVGLATMLMYIVVALIALALELRYAFLASVPFALFVACILPCMRAAGSRMGRGPFGSPRYVFAAAVGLHMLRFGSFTSVCTVFSACLALVPRSFEQSGRKRDV